MWLKAAPQSEPSPLVVWIHGGGQKAVDRTESVSKDESITIGSSASGLATRAGGEVVSDFFVGSPQPLAMTCADDDQSVVQFDIQQKAAPDSRLSINTAAHDAVFALMAASKSAQEDLKAVIAPLESDTAIDNPTNDHSGGSRNALQMEELNMSLKVF
jgi:hypothetical protein